MKRTGILILPICFFFILCAFLWRGLSLNVRALPSALIGRPVPTFHLSTLEDPKQYRDNLILKGKISLIHVWASWCESCRLDHASWMGIQKTLNSDIQVIGLNYRDTLTEAKAWLQKEGNPYQCNLFDDKGEFGMELGVYGIPETYLVDQNGIIQRRHIGPITAEILVSLLGEKE